VTTIDLDMLRREIRALDYVGSSQNVFLSVR